MSKEKSITELTSKNSDALRVPLSSILGYVKLIRVDSDLSVGVQEHLSVIESTTQHLLSFVDNLQTHASFKASDEVKLMKLTISLEDLLSEINELVTPLAKKKGLLFSGVITPRCTRYSFLDKERVMQLLLNLVRNSITYTKEGFVNLTFDQVDDELIFTLIDSGLGLHEDEINKISNAYVDGKNETTTGLGLSLSVSKSLVEMMDGSFEVASDRGDGSTITVKIPYEESEEVKDLGKTQPVQILNEINNADAKKTILLMESKVETSNFISFLLKRSGYEVTVAEDWQLALAFLDALEFDVVISDLKMTEISKKEVIDKIRSSGYQNDVIALLEAPDDQQQEELKDLGFAATLSKPIQMSDLFSVFKRLIPLTG